VEEVRALFWEGYPALPLWSDVVASLRRLVPAGGRIGVLPYGPMQVPFEDLHVHGGVRRTSGGSLQTSP
jgi:hypothetical protein